MSGSGVQSYRQIVSGSLILMHMSRSSAVAIAGTFRSLLVYSQALSQADSSVRAMISSLGVEFQANCAKVVRNAD